MKRLTTVALGLAAFLGAAVNVRAQDAPPQPAHESPDPEVAALEEALQRVSDAGGVEPWSKHIGYVDLTKVTDRARRLEHLAEALAMYAAEFETLSRWAEAADAWSYASKAKPSAASAAGEGRARLAFAEEILASGEPGSAVRAAFEDARTALKRAVQLGATDVAVRIGLARCLAADDRTDDQIAELRALANDLPDDPAPRRALGFALYNAGKHAEAIPVLRELSDAAPADLNLSLTLAASARQVKDEALALAAAHRTIEQHATDSRGWQALWSVYAGDRRFGELTDRLVAMAKAQPDNAYAAHYAGFAAKNANRWDDALVWLDRAWTLDRREVSAHLEAGRILFQQKHDRERAAAVARDVLSAEPGNQEAANLLSFIARRRSDDGDHDGAVRDIEVLAAARADDAIVHANLGLELRWAGRYADAEKAYLRAVELSPRDSQLQNDFGLLYLVVGRDDDALARFRASHEADRQANDGVENLAWMARRDGRHDEALALYRTAYQAAVRRGSFTERHRRNMDEARFPLPPLGRPR